MLDMLITTKKIYLSEMFSELTVYMVVGIK